MWTAAAERLPALFIINNNRSFFNDVEHQARVAAYRDRPQENCDVGMSISNPEVDLTGLARSYGLQSFDPVKRIEDLDAALEKALRAAQEGATVLLDVQVVPGSPVAVR